MKRLFEKFAAFLKEIGRSCYDMEYYRKVRTGSVGAGLAYLASFASFLVVVGLLFIGPQTFSAVGDAKKWIIGHVPDGAQFTLKDGVFSTNMEVPADFGTDGAIVVDTTVSGKEFPEKTYPKADIFIGKEAAWVRKDAAEKREYQLSEVPDFSVTKQQMLDWMGSYAGFAVIGFLFFVALFYFLFFMASAAFYIVIMSVLALFAGRIWKVKLEYNQWMAVGFHAMTLPVLVDIVLGMLGTSIPYSFSFIYILFLGAVIADERSNPTGAAKPAEALPSPDAPVVAPAAKTPRVRKIAEGEKTAVAKPRKPRKKKITPPPNEEV